MLHDAGLLRQVRLATASLLVVAAAAMGACGDDDGSETSDTSAPPTTAVETTTTEEPTTTTSAPAQVDTTTAVFPFAEDDTRFEDPMELAEAYAERYLGFADPTYSEFMQGDSRSGEVVVRPSADGPDTLLLLRQLDETWWVLGAVSDQIQIDAPEAGGVLVSPVAVAGRAGAPDGELSLELWTDGAAEPLAMASAPVGTDALAAFDATLSFAMTPATEHGALLARTYGPDGGVWAASVLRVHF